METEKEATPRPGHVSQLRQNWAMFEDQALAMKIQHEEINQHYLGNKTRNKQIREDLPQALEAQQTEIQEARRRDHEHRKLLEMQAALDAEYAAKLNIKDSEADYVRKRDELFARNLQEREALRYQPQMQQPNTCYPSEFGANSQHARAHNSSVANRYQQNSQRELNNGHAVSLPARGQFQDSSHQVQYSQRWQPPSQHAQLPMTDGRQRYTQHPPFSYNNRQGSSQPHHPGYSRQFTSSQSPRQNNHQQGLPSQSHQLSSHTSHPSSHSAGLGYRDTEYRVQIARPATVVLDEPTYVNSQNQDHMIKYEPAHSRATDAGQLTGSPRRGQTMTPADANEQHVSQSVSGARGVTQSLPPFPETTNHRYNPVVSNAGSGRPTLQITGATQKAGQAVNRPKTSLLYEPPVDRQLNSRSEVFQPNATSTGKNMASEVSPRRQQQQHNLQQRPLGMDQLWGGAFEPSPSIDNQCESLLAAAKEKTEANDERFSASTAVRAASRNSEASGAMTAGGYPVVEPLNLSLLSNTTSDSERSNQTRTDGSSVNNNLERSGSSLASYSDLGACGGGPQSHAHNYNEKERSKDSSFDLPNRFQSAGALDNGPASSQEESRRFGAAGGPSSTSQERYWDNGMSLDTPYDSYSKGEGYGAKAASSQSRYPEAGASGGATVSQQEKYQGMGSDNSAPGISSGRYTEAGACGGISPPSQDRYAEQGASGGAAAIGGYSEMGAYGGTMNSLTDSSSICSDDILGLRSSLSPAEIRAAEEAEKRLEQERKDAELAQRLQAELEDHEGGACGGDPDRRLAIEAQDREFARVLQAKEEARLQRAKDRALQRKLERREQKRLQKAQEQADGDREATLPMSEVAVAEVHARGETDTPRDLTGDKSGQWVPTGHGRSSRLQGGEPASMDCGRGDFDHAGKYTSLRGDGVIDQSQDSIQPPARKPYVHPTAIDSHINETYCKRQITPVSSNASSEAEGSASVASSHGSSEQAEPQYANLDKRGQPIKKEPILSLSKSGERMSPRANVLTEDMPVPPYMPMQNSHSKRYECLENKIKKKKEKEGCKQQ